MPRTLMMKLINGNLPVRNGIISWKSIVNYESYYRIWYQRQGTRKFCWGAYSLIVEWKAGTEGQAKIWQNRVRLLTVDKDRNIIRYISINSMPYKKISDTGSRNHNTMKRIMLDGASCNSRFAEFSSSGVPSSGWVLNTSDCDLCLNSESSTVYKM